MRWNETQDETRERNEEREAKAEKVESSYAVSPWGV